MSPRQIDLSDHNTEPRTKRECLPIPLPPYSRCADVHIPPIVPEILNPDQAINQILRVLHEQAELCHTRDHAFEPFAHLLREQRKNLERLEFPLSALGTAGKE